MLRGMVFVCASGSILKVMDFVPCLVISLQCGEECYMTVCSSICQPGSLPWDGQSNAIELHRCLDELYTVLAVGFELHLLLWGKW